jgi:DNA helicase HerA-like ATPase
MKGSGKSYAAKKLLLELIEKKVLTLVFDLNAEYLNLWKSEDNKPNRYATQIKILTPHLRSARVNEIPFFIPLNEITYDDFARFMEVPQGAPTYQVLLQFWRQRAGAQFDINDLDNFVSDPINVPNEAVRVALQGRVETARALGIFGPSNLTNLIKDMHTTGGAIVFNVSRVNQWERSIIVEFVLRKLALMGQSNEIRAVSLFLEEAQLYVTQENIVNILTRMRHLGIFPTFITNDPRTLPDEVFTLLDNLIAFMFHNDDELKRIAKSGLIDLRTVQSLKHLEPRQCVVVGNVTSNYPIFVEILPQKGVIMGGETRKLLQ